MFFGCIRLLLSQLCRFPFGLQGLVTRLPIASAVFDHDEWRFVLQTPPLPIVRTTQRQTIQQRREDNDCTNKDKTEEVRNQNKKDEGIFTSFFWQSETSLPKSGRTYT